MRTTYNIEKKFPFYIVKKRQETINPWSERILGVFFTKRQAENRKLHDELLYLRLEREVMLENMKDSKEKALKMRELYNIETKTERRPAPMNNCFIDGKTNIENATDEILQVLNKYNLTVFQRDAVFQKVNDYINNHTYINAK